MAFERPRFESFYQVLETISRSSDIEIRCIAENFILEERLAMERENSYGEHFENPVTEVTWNDGHENYVEEKIYVHSSTPETFTALNNPNLLTAPDPDQYLVRLENISRLEFFQDKGFNEVMDHFQEYIKEPEEAKNKNFIKDFFYKWNETRDYRPAFAGFWGEVKDIFTNTAGNRIDDKDWANRLRDRFGLGHLNSKDGEPIPVLMFRYRVRDVIEANKDEINHVAIPTILDGDFSVYFCPTPKKGWNQGQALDLTDGNEDDYSINCEILHRSIPLKPENLYSAGWVNRSPGKTLEKARKIHLAFLMDDFENRVRIMNIREQDEK